jgi:poly(A) polymerase
MHIKPDQIDPDAAKVVQRLRRYDHTAYLVGGCVRDLLLGRKPKDFDVATSANPNEIKRLFRNCRIIGRRFRLAHIFFGAKIIETATFRANPREVEDDPSESSGGESENGDLLIRRDNVFGSAEEDARRRDFTINGLFYDLETAQVIDYVHGMADLETRLVRTIGDPDIRFREDPVRILRAVKFAARCDLTVEPETYRRMMEHSGRSPSAPRPASPRSSTAFLRAGRGQALHGAAARDAPARRAGARAGQRPPPRRGRRPRQADGALLGLPRRARSFDHQARHPALERAGAGGAAVPAPARRPSPRHQQRARRGAAGGAVDPAHHRAPQVVRRDAELARQILLAMRYLFPSSNPNRRRPRLSGREFLDDALRLAELVTDAETATPELAGQPLLAEGEPPGAPAGEELPPELQAPDPSERHGRFRHGRRGREERATRFEERREPAPESGGGYQRPASVGGGRRSRI